MGGSRIVSNKDINLVEAIGRVQEMEIRCIICDKFLRERILGLSEISVKVSLAKKAYSEGWREGYYVTNYGCRGAVCPECIEKHDLKLKNDWGFNI